MPLSRRLESLGNGVFARMDHAKQVYCDRVSSQGAPALIDLSIGSSDLEPPLAVLEAMATGIMHPSSASYCLQSGMRPFHQVAADWCQQRFGVTVDPDREVQLLIGSQEGTAHLPLAVLDPGDHALHLDPCYPSHSGGLNLAGALIRTLPLTAEQGWRPDLSLIPSSQWDQLKLFVFGYPHNPTSTVGDQEDLNRIMAMGSRHELVIAHDNPYVDLSLGAEAPCLLRTAGWRTWGIEFFSLSKAWCLGGFRLGFAIGAEPLIKALRRTKALIDFNQSLALQQGAIRALRDFADWPRQLLPVFRNRRDRVVSALESRGWLVQAPDMAMYLWMPLPEQALRRGWSDEQTAAELLMRSGVALTPGSGFGPGGGQWLRMAMVRPLSDLEAAVERLVDALGS